jgi:hypothetical protein
MYRWAGLFKSLTTIIANFFNMIKNFFTADNYALAAAA